MGRAVFQVMILRIFRDPGALLLTFVLPGVIYIIFATIFSNAGGGELSLRVALADEIQTEASETVRERLKAAGTVTLLRSPEEAEERVRLGVDDVGLVISADPASAGTDAFIIIEEPGRKVASRVLSASLAGGGPDIAVRSTGSQAVADASVAYYIGAVGMMFLLFSTLQAAAVSLEERNGGISERLLVGMRGAVRLFRGKFIFLALVGTFQIASICAVAAIFFDVPVVEHFGAVALACICVATFSAGFALFVASLCSTASQLHAVSTFLVLMLSAVGGSMIPRFMMPDSLQGLSRWTPNGWAIDAFYGVLAREQTVAELWWVWCILLGGGAMLSVAAAAMSQRLGRI